MKKEFPEHWWIKVTEETLPSINKVRAKQKVAYEPIKVGQYEAYQRDFNDTTFGGTTIPPIKSGQIEVTLEEFNEHFGISESPEKWYIEATSENFDELSTWRHMMSGSEYGLFSIGNLLLSKHHFDNSYYFFGKESDLLKVGDGHAYGDYTKITLEQFRKITANKAMEIRITREQLISLFDKDSCSDWNREIKEILNANLLNSSNEIIVPKKSIDLLLENGSDKQKNFVTELGIVLPKKECEKYLENQNQCGLQIGDTVRVTRTSQYGENGWNVDWRLSMDDLVGKELKITDIEGRYGIRLNDSFLFPFFVLEKVELGDKYEINDVVILSDDSSWKGWRSDGFEYVGEKGKIKYKLSPEYCTVEFRNGSYNCRYSSLIKVVEEYEKYSLEDDLLGRKILRKSDGIKLIITGQFENSVYSGSMSFTYGRLLEDFVNYPDGTPCGNLIKK